MPLNIAQLISKRVTASAIMPIVVPAGGTASTQLFPDETSGNCPPGKEILRRFIYNTTANTCFFAVGKTCWDITNDRLVFDGIISGISATNNGMVEIFSAQVVNAYSTSGTTLGVLEYYIDM